MIFKFPKKKVVLDCFTHYEHILQTAPITNAIKHIPDWWKALPVSFEKEGFIPSGTMKNCSGLVEYYKNSIAIPLWSDLIIKVNNQEGYTWKFADDRTEVVVHDMRQRIDFLGSYGHMKIQAPWQLKTKEKVQWVWSQPSYSFSDENIGIQIPPGVINYYNQGDANINLLFPVTQGDKTYLLKQGQVMAHLTPMFDNKIEIVRHLVSEQEYSKMIPLGFANTFHNRRANYEKQQEKFLDCPYKKEMK